MALVAETDASRSRPAAAGTATQAPRTQRLVQLDGLRGVAAVIVVISHVITGFFPRFYFGGTVATEYLLTSPLFVLWSGQFAVSIFFALSGFVIAGSAERQTPNLSAVLLCRYLRLAIPMVASVMLAYLLIRIWPTSATEAAQLTDSEWLAKRYTSPTPTLTDAIYEAAAGTFIKGYSYFNNPFWTMRYELIGSFVIYTAHRALPRRAIAIMTIITSIALLWTPTPWQTILPMAIGTAIYHFRSHMRLLTSRAAIWLLILTAVLGGYPYINPNGSAYGMFAHIFPSNTGDVVRAVGAGILLWIVIAWEPACRALSASVTQFFGSISYPLYLLHFPLLATFLSQMRISAGGHALAFAVAIMTYFVMTILLAWAFEMIVDRPTVRGLSALRTTRRSLVKADAAGNNNQPGHVTMAADNLPKRKRSRAVPEESGAKTREEKPKEG